MKTGTSILLTLLLAVPATWYATRQLSPQHNPTPAATERKIRYYQSAMHPWVQSDKPGRCTICGMALTPVFEGEKGFETSSDVVSLNQSMIQVLHVETAQARTQPLIKTLSFSGLIDDDARRHRIISAYVDGRIEKLFINHHGAEVAEGKLLAEIYSPSLLQAEREYRSLKGEMQQNAALRLRQMGLTPEQIANLPAKAADVLTSEILSPISGTVVNDEIYAGQYVTAGQKLLELADFSTMWFVFRVYEQDIPWLKTGQLVQITTPSVPGQTFEGPIAFIDPNFDPVTRTTQVRVELPNPSVNGRRTFFHRLYGEAQVKVDAPAVLTIPRSAVIQTGSEAVVYLDQTKGAYLRQPVKLGSRGDTLVEVLSGIAEGDQVVTNGNLLLDGQAEMNRSFSAQPVNPQTDKGISATGELSAAQHSVITAFITAADSVADALAKDDLEGFRKAIPAVGSGSQALATALTGRPELSSALHKLLAPPLSSSVQDIKTARHAFYSFSTAAVEILERLRGTDKTVVLEVFECPMVGHVIPGVPMKGKWLQRAGSEIRNPYMGTDMPICGVKIQP